MQRTCTCALVLPPRGGDPSVGEGHSAVRRSSIRQCLADRPIMSGAKCKQPDATVLAGRQGGICAQTWLGRTAK